MGVVDYFAKTEVCMYTRHFINDSSGARIINKTFPNIYVTTLLEEGSVTRITHTQHVLRKLGANYTVCYMTRPTEEVYNDYLRLYDTMSPELKLNKAYHMHCIHKLTSPELGCCASHIWILRHLNNPIIKGTQHTIQSTSSSKLYLILEDDIMPIHDFESKIQSFVEAHNNYTETCELLMLTVTDYHYKERNHKIANTYYIPSLKSGRVCGMGAYAVNLDYANNLQGQLLSFTKPADHYFTELFDTVLDVSRACVMYPPLFLTDMTESTIQVNSTSIVIRSDYIQKCLPNINFYDYDYMPIVCLRDNSIMSALKNMVKKSVKDIPGGFLDEITAMGNNKLAYDLGFEFMHALKYTSWTISDFELLLNDMPDTSPQILQPPPIDLAVCISYFNPANRIRPFQNLLYCIQRIYAAGIPVYIMELVYEWDKPQLNNLPNVFHVKSNSVLFHKENLWNLLEKKVPEQYTKLIFLDGDILFKDKNWTSIISKMLDTTSVIQPYDVVEQMNITFKCNKQCICFIKAFQERIKVLGAGNFSYPATGYAIALQRKWLNDIGGFPELCVMGGGDYIFIDIITQSMAYKRYPQYIRQPYIHQSINKLIAKIKQTDYTYSYAKLTIQHMFHGTTVNRQYNTRYKDTQYLSINDFKVNTDGVIEFVDPSKWNPITQKYFFDRDDDAV